MKPETATDWLTILAGILGAVKLLLAAPPFEYELPQETVDSFVNLVSWVAAGYAIWRNNKKPADPTPPNHYPR